MPLWESPTIPEGHIFTYHGISKITGLSREDVKCLTKISYNRNLESLVHPKRVNIRHYETNFFSEEDLQVFIKVKLLKAEGLHVTQALDLLREKGLSIAQILQRPQSIRHIIITNPEIFSGLTKDNNLF